MFKCNVCGTTSARAVRVYGRYGIESERCVRCGSGEISESEVSCDICGRALWKGETAFEAGNMLICRKCVVEVTV